MIYLFSAGTFIVPAMPIEGVGGPRIIGIAGIMNGGAQMAINHVWKTVIALFMCVLTLFAFGLKLAVQAHAFAISAGVIGLIAVILGTLGFTFATSAELQRVCSQYYNQASSEIQTAFTSAAEFIEDGVIKWNDLKSVFTQTVMLAITASLVSFMDDGVEYHIINGVNDYVYENMYNASGFAVPLYVASLESVAGYIDGVYSYISCYNIAQSTAGIPVTVKVSGGMYGPSYFSFGFSVNYGGTVLMSSSSGTLKFARDTFDVIEQSAYTKISNLFIAPCKIVRDGITYLSFVFCVLGADGVRRYFGSDAAIPFNLTDLASTTVTDYYGETGAIDDGVVGQAWQQELDQEHDDTDVINLTDSLPWIAAHETTDVIDTTYTQSDVLTDVGLQDTVGDLTNTNDTTLPLDIDDYKVPPTWKNPSNGQTIKFSSIFPFCIPFDIYDFLSLLSATRTAPHFEIPFNYDRIGLDYTFVIDLSVVS